MIASPSSDTMHSSTAVAPAVPYTVGEKQDPQQDMVVDEEADAERATGDADGASSFQQPEVVTIDETENESAPLVDKENVDTSESLFEHGFEAGDHVIRWEMLPIVYPIQIHGIVLETGPDFVTIADFGLTSYDDCKKNSTEKPEPLIDDVVSQRMDEIVTSYWEKMRTTENKSRLNVITIRDEKVIKTWKKVNYGENMFSSAKKGSPWWRRSSVKEDKGQAGSDSDGKVVCTSPKADPNDDADDTGKVEATSPKDDKDHDDADDGGKVECNALNIGSQSNGDMTEVAPRPISEEESVEGCNEAPSPTAEPSGTLPIAEQTGEAGNIEKVDCTTDDLPGNAQPSKLEIDTSQDNGPRTLEQLIAEANKIERTSPPARVVFSPKNEPSNHPLKRKSWWPSSSRKNASQSASNSEPEGEQGNPTARPGWWSRSGYQMMPVAAAEGAEAETPLSTKFNERHMNPAMSSLLASTSNGDRSSSKNSKPSGQKLPKSDPPKLVLARARFLLEHGEKILPPYHVFYSNSECIAVWCMTGRWSTLQAAVFLHSTAIGNAKSSTAIALGVAATQPWLIPVLAGVGIAAVGMPWLILKRSKEKWEKATQILTYLFWQQAEPEVFVECIEKWSGLCKEQNET